MSLPVGVQLLKDIGLNVDPPQGRDPWDYICEDESVSFQDQTDRDILEAHGIMVECTPVDAFMNRGYGFLLADDDG
ncbi:hypothetical protein Ql52_gp014 [Caulobacter phage Quill_5.2]|uniref:Uncharacterized protein n=1 Tax=Caulobacter phage Quill_5.2 TaxID=3075108 RepID=A0AA96T1T3_9CAUD|nr:hypothetical protein Ql52_gp014 [Caulobacter phage Quill_5.2]